MRIATYNVEWFNSLFDDAGTLLDDGQWSARHDVTRTQQLAALGIVFTAMDADAVMVVEAPDHNSRRATVPALENFAKAFGLRARKALIGFPNDTQQEIALLYDPDVMSARHDPQGYLPSHPVEFDTPRFDGVYKIDLDIDAQQDRVVFSKPPLEAAVRLASGFEMRMIGVHLKSKAPYGAGSPDEMMRIAIANRRKQLAQAIWLRARLRAVLEAGEPLMVMGDLNDGPGLDEYENLFGRSSVEIVMGDGDGAVGLYDPHAREALSRKIGAQRSTSRFYVAPENRYLQALLDYIMVSPDLAGRRPVWRIWHPFDDPQCYKVVELREALLTASDHFPVSVDIDFGD